MVRRCFFQNFWSLFKPFMFCLGRGSLGQTWIVLDTFADEVDQLKPPLFDTLGQGTSDS